MNSVAAFTQEHKFSKTRNLILESAAEPHFPKLKIWFKSIPDPEYFSQNRYDYDIVVTVRKFLVMAHAVQRSDAFVIRSADLLAAKLQTDSTAKLTNIQ
ncbi:MAG TPA: hypothetical protein V6C78_05380 [Crinalium sp.]